MTLNLAALIFFGLCWGSTVPLIKFAVGAGHHPLGMISWQLSVSVLGLGVYMLIKRMRISFEWGTLPYLLFVALLGTLIPNSFSLLATAQLPAGVIALVIATVPIVSLAIALVFRIEKFSWLRFTGVLLGVLALILIAVPDATLPDPGKAPWILVALIAPVCYAIEGNFVAVKAPAHLTPVATLFGASVCGLMLLWPLVYVNGWQVPVLVTWDTSRWAMVLAALGHMTAYTGYIWLLGRTGAVFTSQVAYVVTLTGVFLSVIFLGERYGWLLWVAVLLMLVAVTLVRPAGVKKPKVQAPSLDKKT